jgi:hypothetical protein
MAMTVGEARVLIEADLNKLNAGLNKGESTVKSWTTKIGGFFTGAFVVGVGIAIAKFVGLVADGMKKAAGLVQNIFIAAIKETDEGIGQVKRLANEIGDLEDAESIIDSMTQLSIDWKVSTDDLIDGYTRLRRFFEEGFIMDSLEDIASASKQLEIPVGELSQMLAGIGEGMLSARRLLAMGVSKKDLAGAGVKFDIEDPDKIISDSKVVLDAIIKIWHEKYTNGPGKDLQTMGGFITQLRDLWEWFLDLVGSAGVYDLVINKLQGIVAWVQNNSEQIKTWATDISKFFSDTFNGLTAVLEKVFGVSFNAPEVMPNVNKSDEDVAKSLGFSEEQMINVGVFLANGFTDAFKNSPEWKTIGEDVKKYLDFKNVITGGGANTPLTPFWDKIVESLKTGDFKTRLATALTGIIEGIGSNQPLLDAAGQVGAKIFGAILTGLATAFGDWESEVGKGMNDYYLSGDFGVDIFNWLHGTSGGRSTGPGYGTRNEK